MSTMRNSVVLIGIPTQPIIKDGKSVVKFAIFKLAVTETYKNANNEYVTCTNVFDCYGNGKIDERIAKTVKEGKELAIDGKLRRFEWNDPGTGHHSDVRIELDDLFPICK